MPERNAEKINPRQRQVVLFGGFARIGGIESFIADLLKETPRNDRSPGIDFLCWSESEAMVKDRLPPDIAIQHSTTRWGCRLGIPDLLLVLLYLPVLLRAGQVILGKEMAPVATRLLVALRKLGWLKARFVYITPYRPLELWGEQGPRDAFSLFDAIVVQAPEFAEDLARMQFAGDVFVVPYIPPRPVKLGDEGPHDPLRIGSLGRLEPQKNLHYLVDIAARLATGAPDLDFEVHIYGEGSQRQALEEHVRSAGLENIFVFHGAIPREQVPEAMSSCDLFLITSTTEGQCLVALEILSIGRPLVATAAGALPAILSDATRGAIIPFDDPVAAAGIVAETCRALKNGRYTRDRVTESYLKDFDADRVAQEYARLLGW